MATVNKWAGVTIAMQSALATAKTITAIAKGATATVTATHDYSAGDYVVMTVSGMTELDARVVRILSVSTTVSFVIEGATGVSLDTTLFGTFTAGTCQKVTFGTSLATVTGLTSSGGEADMIDITTLGDKVKRSMPGIPSAMEMSFENIWDVSDTALIALKAASDAGTTRAFKMTFSGGAIMCVNGYVAATMIPTGSFGDKALTSVKIMGQGLPFAFSS